MKQEKQRRNFWWKTSVLLLGLALASSCRTGPALPPVNVAEPGWKLQQGQAVWRPRREAPEIAGEILFATYPGQQTLLQLTKNPLPFVTAQTSGDRWQITFVPQGRKFSGTGTPSPRLLWVHLARALTGTKPPAPLHFELKGVQNFTLENPASGESITGFLNE
jgi:hypothetical protein